MSRKHNFNNMNSSVVGCGNNNSHHKKAATISSSCIFVKNSKQYKDLLF